MVEKLEIMKFVSENDLLYIGESSALADINIKEVVETLMESKNLNRYNKYRYSWNLIESGWKEDVEFTKTQRKVF